MKGSRPRVWRCIQVPSTYTFYDLHQAIQDCMNLGNSNSIAKRYLFRMVSPKNTILKPKKKVDENGFISYDLGPYNCAIKDSELIADKFLQKRDKVNYSFDMNEIKIFSVKFERAVTATQYMQYPCCIGGKIKAPPEYATLKQLKEYQKTCRDFSFKDVTFDRAEKCIVRI